MAKKDKNNRMVYSTNPDFDLDDEKEKVDTLPPNQQKLEVHLDRKNRSGKTATVVKGYVGTDVSLSELGKQLKSSCGVGGSVKDNEIIIQGENRDKVMEILKKKGYQVKRVGG